LKGIQQGWSDKNLEVSL